MTSWPLDILPLIRRLAQEKPIDHGLLIGPDCRNDQWLGDWHCIRADQLAQMPFSQRHDLAAIWLTDATSNNNGDDDILSHGLTRLRDLLARQVWVLTHPTHTQRLRELGFSCIEDLGEWQMWQFNILEYKHIPDWFNSKYWANPENWGKYRW